MPVWAFHVQKDNVIPFSRSEEIVTALKEHGNNVKFTIYPVAGHYCWDKKLRQSITIRIVLKTFLMN